METRLYLEKIRPIDKKLKYQIDKLLKAAERAGGADEGRRAGGAGGEDDDLQLRPNIGEIATWGSRSVVQQHVLSLSVVGCQAGSWGVVGGGLECAHGGPNRTSKRV